MVVIALTKDPQVWKKAAKDDCLHFFTIFSQVALENLL